MLIVSLETTENGARGNQVIYPALEHVPEGWAVVPPELEEEALQFLPWMTLTVVDGAITGVGDDVEARAAAKAASPDDIDDDNNFNERMG